MSREIHKKIWSSFFQKVVDGEKTFELRLDDFKCETGDVLVLDEVDDKTKEYTGRSLRKKVGFVFKTKDQGFFTQDEIDKHGLQIISLLEDRP